MLQNKKGLYLLIIGIVAIYYFLQSNRYLDTSSLVIFTAIVLYILIGEIQEIYFIKNAKICEGKIISYTQKVRIESQTDTVTNFDLLVEIQLGENLKKTIEIKKTLYQLPQIGESVTFMVLGNTYKPYESGELTTAIINILVVTSVLIYFGFRYLYAVKII